MHHTDLIARRIDVGFGAGHERSRLESRGTIDSNWLGAKPYPPAANSARLARLVPSSTGDDISARGWIGGAPSALGARARIQRAGGEGTTPSVPVRRFCF